MNKIKVLVANDTFNRGGQETLILDIISYSNKYGSNNSFELLLNYAKGELIRELDKTIKVHIISRRKKIDIRSLFKIRTLLKTSKFTVIHTHSPTLGLYILIAKTGLNIPMVQTIHGFWDKRSSSGKPQIIHLLLTYILMFFCKRNIIVSNYLQSEYLKYYLPKKKFTVIYNGINFEKFNVEKKSEPNFNDKIKFGMVGNFNYGRSHETLIDAFVNISSKYSNIILLLAGSGELLEFNKNKVAELRGENKIIFTGTCDTIPKFLQNLDCFIYSSRNDSFGIAVLEAMYLGIPVIVSNNGPFIELTNNGEYATLFECENPNDLQSKIESFLQDSTANNNLAQKAKNYVKKNFSIERNFSQTIMLYKQILEN